MPKIKFFFLFGLLVFDGPPDDHTFSVNRKPWTAILKTWHLNQGNFCISSSLSSLTGRSGSRPQTETFIMCPCIFGHHVNIKTTLLASHEGQMQRVPRSLWSLPVIHFQLTPTLGQDEVLRAQVWNVCQFATSLLAKGCMCCWLLKSFCHM